MPSATRRSAAALILIDVVDVDFNNRNRLLRTQTLKAAKHMASLKALARRSGVPVIFVNDHFGDWHSDFRGLVGRCIEKGGDSAALVNMLAPDERDYSILKPRHSAFYGTPLTFLLEELKVERLILAGIQADMCVMFTASDAYIRKFELWVPRNCVAAASTSGLQRALRLIKDNLNADIAPSPGRPRPEIFSTRRRSRIRAMTGFH